MSVYHEWNDATCSNTMMRICLAFLMIGLFGFTGSASVADSSNLRFAMANAMLKMMDAMGFLGANRANSGMGNAPWEAPAAMPWPGVNPQGMMENWRENPWSPPMNAATAGIDGAWASNSGERLTLRGGRFRLEAGSGQRIDGIFQLQGARLALYQPRLHQGWVYDYAAHEGQLVLRDAQGQLFLYRRIGPLP
jgi:hypothetical protein